MIPWESENGENRALRDKLLYGFNAYTKGLGYIILWFYDEYQVAAPSSCFDISTAHTLGEVGQEEGTAAMLGLLQTGILSSILSQSLRALEFNVEINISKCPWDPKLELTYGPFTYTGPDMSLVNEERPTSAPCC